MNGSGAFAPLSGPPGFYPVVPDARWVAQLLDWGVRTVQLRLKADPDQQAQTQRQVRAAVQASRAFPDAQLFINDHWQLALEAGAYGVHLGQGDWAELTQTQRQRLRGSGIRLGLSTHTPQEMALALAAQPSYVAIGPVFPTTLKRMPYAPVGLDQLKDWTGVAGAVPVVAIGGIALAQMEAVWACGVRGVAVVSAVTQAPDPRAVVRQALALAATRGQHSSVS